MIVRRATSAADMQAVAGLMRQFVEWQYVRHAEDRHIIDSYFDPVGFAAELDGLPGEFASPKGELLVAEDEGTIVGCVALRPLSDDTCEMKRMFVSADCHGKGVGMLLGRAIVQAAKDIGYRTMFLDTGPKQIEAQALYHKLGFRDVAPYYDVSPQLGGWLVFMEQNLE